jgi:hypothetical protein
MKTLSLGADHSAMKGSHETIPKRRRPADNGPLTKRSISMRILSDRRRLASLDD